jgi:hypothetical protein
MSSSWCRQRISPRGLKDNALRFANPKRGEVSVLIKEVKSRRIAIKADLKPRPSPVEVLGPAAFQVMALATRQHYLAETSAKLEGIYQSVDEIKALHNDKSVGVLNQVRKLHSCRLSSSMGICRIFQAFPGAPAAVGNPRRASTKALVSALLDPRSGTVIVVQGHITINREGVAMTPAAGLPSDAPPPAEHGRQWIEIELDHPVNPWEHEGAGSITWGAHLDRLAPLGEEAVSIILEAWEHRQDGPHDAAKREREESEPIQRTTRTGPAIKPGWASRVEFSQYWLHLTLYQAINERWREESGVNWSRGELINDGIVKRGVTVEATTRLGRRALGLVEALHSAHPFGELQEPPDRGDWYR